jgi:hypothetical protein
MEDVSADFEVGGIWRQAWSVARHVRRLAAFWADTVDEHLVIPWRQSLSQLHPRRAPCAVTADTPFFCLDVDARGRWRYAEFSSGTPTGTWSFSWKSEDGIMIRHWMYPRPPESNPCPWQELVTRRLGFDRI